MRPNSKEIREIFEFVRINGDVLFSDYSLIASNNIFICIAKPEQLLFVYNYTDNVFVYTSPECAARYTDLVKAYQTAKKSKEILDAHCIICGKRLQAKEECLCETCNDREDWREQQWWNDN